MPHSVVQARFTAPLGKSLLCLTIVDSKAKSLAACDEVEVVRATEVPGAQVQYHAGKHSVVHRPSGKPTMLEVRQSLGVLGVPAIDPPFVAVVRSSVKLPSAGGTFTLNRPWLSHAIMVGGRFYNGGQVGRSRRYH